MQRKRARWEKRAHAGRRAHVRDESTTDSSGRASDGVEHPATLSSTAASRSGERESMAEDTGREGSQMRGALGARHSLSCHNDFMNSMIRVLQETGSSYPTRFGRATRAILFASEGQLNLHARDAVLYRRWGTWGGRPQGQPGGCHLGLGEEDSRMSRAKGEAQGARV